MYLELLKFGFFNLLNPSFENRSRMKCELYRMNYIELYELYGHPLKKHKNTDSKKRGQPC